MYFHVDLSNKLQLSKRMPFGREHESFNRVVVLPSAGNQLITVTAPHQSSEITLTSAESENPLTKKCAGKLSAVISWSTDRKANLRSGRGERLHPKNWILWMFVVNFMEMPPPLFLPALGRCLPQRAGEFQPILQTEGRGAFVAIAVRELCVRIFRDIGFQLGPVTLVIPDLFATATNGQQAAQRFNLRQRRLQF